MPILETCDAPPITEDVPCVRCHDQAHGKHGRGGRRHVDAIARAAYACESCGQPVCRKHLLHDHDAEQWLCILCEAKIEAVRYQRRGRD